MTYAKQLKQTMKAYYTPVSDPVAFFDKAFEQAAGDEDSSAPASAPKEAQARRTPPPPKRRRAGGPSRRT